MRARGMMLALVATTIVAASCVDPYAARSSGERSSPDASVASADAQENLHVLYREAMATPTPEDEAIVRRIEATVGAIRRAEREADGIRAKMRDLAQRYPGYGWETNVGYSTAEHFDGIRRLGVTPHHRRSFEPVRLALSAPANLFALLEAGSIADTVVANNVSPATVTLVVV